MLPVCFSLKKKKKKSYLYATASKLKERGKKKKKKKKARVKKQEGKKFVYFISSSSLFPHPGCCRCSLFYQVMADRKAHVQIMEWFVVSPKSLGHFL
jgi:hypothetical protein